MLVSIFSDLKKQLSSALKHKKHPFRYGTLATTGLDGSPHLRTVVLRGFDQEMLTLTIYTDSRSDKIKELSQDPRAEFLFYDSSQFLQLRIKVNLIHDAPSKEIYNQIPEPSKKDYTSIFVPGEEIKAPDAVTYNYDQPNFTELIFQAYELEYLKLKRPNHLRVKFLLNHDWEGSFIAP